MSTLTNDIKYALRMLAKSPGFTCIAVSILALGIGANTAIFTLINTLMFKSLPVKDPHQLVLVTDGGSSSFGYPLYKRLRDGGESFSGIFAATGLKRHSIIVADANATEPESAWTRAVSGSFFSMLGVPSTLGRILTPNDDLAGNPQAVVVISHGFWQRRFGLDPKVIGKRIILEEVPFTIVGVAAPDFSGFELGRSTDLWWPIQMFPQVVPGEDPLTDLTDMGSWLRVMGRLKAGIPQEQACEELDVIFKQFLTDQAPKWGVSEEEWQNDYARRRIELQAGGTGYTGLRDQFRQPLLILMAIAGLVLLVACANLAGLLLARGTARQREFSVRAALGAGRFTLVRQLVTESLLLAALGGVFGLLLAQLGVRLLAGYIPGYGETVQLEVAPDLRILAFTLVVSAFTGVLFGLIPAWRATRLDLVTALKDQMGNLMSRESGHLWNKALVVSQIALSCCLLIGTGLFVRTVQKLKALDVGFNRENLMVFNLDLGKHYDDTSRANLYQEVMRRLENLPGVRSASFSSIRSMSGSEMGWGPSKVAVEGIGSSAEEGLKVRGTGVGLRYFETMGIPLLRGRDFGPQDEPTPGWRDKAKRAVIIDQTSARKLFGDKNPVGRLLLPIGRDDWPALEVIGVVGDVIHKNLRWGKRISIYGLETHLYRQYFYARTFGSPLATAGGIRQIVRELDPKVEVSGLQTMNDLVNDQLVKERTISQLASFFSLSALVLTCIGLYGILSYGVVRRTREIGVRIALGAQTRDVLSVVIRQGMTLTLAGCVLGVILAVASTRFVSSLLYGVTSTDPITFVLTIALLIGVALLACYIPARRAAKIDPMEALRYE
jgi:predicted permease